MKYNLIIIFLIVICGINSIVNSQTIYSIPWAQTQPKFVFPIYFEEGNGHKDTLYLGYDSLANGYSINGNPNQDTIFGVKKVPIDTSKFYVTWSTTLFETSNRLKDSVYKANVSNISSNHFPNSQSIIFNNGNLPLKISWDKNLFYSDSLPFANSSPAPNAEGRFVINFNNDDQISENGFIETSKQRNDANCGERSGLEKVNIFNYCYLHNQIQKV